MVALRVPKPWHLPEREVTAESAYGMNRRQLLQLLFGASMTPLIGCSKPPLTEAPIANPDITDLGLHQTNPAFDKVDRPITSRLIAASYNNFYEFGGTKGIWRAAQALPLENWQVEVTGLVKNPQTYDLDDLRQKFPLEERIYRFRCVEAWSMALPWIGFPMRSLMAAVEPTTAAKFVRFVSYYDPKVTYGPIYSFAVSLPWPYTEALRIEEMANDLAFFAVGIYGQTLPKQNGAPIRAVLPWKYGFKGAKSIVKIEFTDRQPATYWNTLQANEYDLVANVNPNKPHPRWSQAKERFVGNVSEFSWEERPTLPYNGYSEYVADLYKTM